MDQFIGQITLFSFPYAPMGWAQCNGQLLPINQNHALFALVGTRFGGDGRTTFALPDLRGRTPVHRGRVSSLAPQEIAGRTPVRSADQAATPPPTGAVAMNFCIAILGLFPTRN